MPALVLLLFIASACYFMSRAVFLAFAGYGPFEKVLSIFFFLAEFFVMFHAFGYFSNIYRLSKVQVTEVKEGEVEERVAPPPRRFPQVAVLIPARHEPKDVLESTVVSCYNIDYPSKTIYILDDSSEKSYMDEAMEISQRYGAKLFRRQTRHGAKAGVINDCMKTLDEEYMAIFDVDQNPMPDFLKKLVPFLEDDAKLAFVQTPQFYSNLTSGKVSFGAQMQQSVFYEYVCEGKNSDQAMICCGTNVVMRRQALLDVGGLDESTVTEDFATSLYLQLKGWRTMYYNHVNTFGMGPTDLGAYFQQQDRWARGNIGVLKIIISRFFRSPFSLKPAQWFEYLITGSYYLIGCAYIFLIFCPILYIFFNIPSFFMNPVVYSLAFIPYFLLSVGIFYVSMGRKKYSPLQLFEGQALMFLTLPVFIGAAVGSLLGFKGTFKVTSKASGARISYLKLWPQLFLWSISLSAITWGINRLYYERTVAVLINIVWILYHFILLSFLFYYDED